MAKHEKDGGTGKPEDDGSGGGKPLPDKPDPNKHEKNDRGGHR